jgi:PKHD-type hydroxylase
MTRHPRFVTAALPHRFFPLRFGRYREGGGYGTHVDGSIMSLPGSPDVVRSDVSATLFLSSADAYEGGELVIEGDFGATEVKLEAGDMVLYPSSSLHRVQEVTSGTRTVVLVWLQSMVRDAGRRSLLYDLDQSIQALTRAEADPGERMRLTGVYHNLLRRWSEV